MSLRSLLVPCLPALLLVASPLPARQTVEGHLRPEFTQAATLGTLDPATPLTLDVGLPVKDPSGLSAFLAALYDPASPAFRRFLTPDSFAERFGPSLADYRSVAAFLGAQGLTVSRTVRSRLLLQVRGRADAIQRAFHVAFLRHPRPDGGEYFALDREPSVDLDVPLQHITGLDNFSRKVRHLRRRPRAPGTWARSRALPRQGTGSGQALDAYQGYDFRATYLPSLPVPVAPGSWDGSGQNLGLVEFSGYYADDIALYESSSNPPLPSTISLSPVLLDGFDGLPADNGDTEEGGPEADSGEVCIDIENAMSMAPGAVIIPYEAPFSASFDDVVSRAADDNTCAQVSCSWGGGATGYSNLGTLLSQMAAQGQSFLNATGDDGAYASSNQIGPVGEPDISSVYITEVGGTSLTTTAGGASGQVYVGESVWNDYLGSCNYVTDPNATGGASGGGICTNLLALPSFQDSIVGSNSASGQWRNVPDVAMVASNFAGVYWNGPGADQTVDVFDGTSGATPLWAGLLALANQQGQALGKPRLGCVNPSLYALAASPSTYAADFHDITTGNNGIVSTRGTSCDPVSYSAGTGYDLTTGLGSPAGVSLIQALVEAIPTSTVSPTITRSPTVTPTATLTPTFSSSPTATPTPSITPTFTVSPTVTPSSTASPTPSITPTFTVSPTVTPSATASPTPDFKSTRIGLAVLGPVPAHLGQPVALYFSAEPSHTRWAVYNIAGERVATQECWGEGPHQVSTQGWAPGVYLARIDVTYASGFAETVTQKFVLIR